MATAPIEPQTQPLPTSGQPGPSLPRKAQRKQDFTQQDGWLTRTAWFSRIVYWGIHASCLLVFVVGAPIEAVLLGVTTYFVRVFGITGGYHRYFSHKTYKTSRAFQFILAFIGCASTQKGPLWWSGTHRRHHRFTDAPGDPHSPKEGYYYAHQGWVFDSRWEGTPVEGIKDFSKYPELRWLNEHHWAPPLALAFLCYAIAGWAGVIWGFSISTTLQWHATYSVNSAAHIWGTRRYETDDTSKNNWWVALLTMGEGWHNNHHYYMASARNGFYWWEIDVTWYILKTLSAFGIVWDLKVPSRELRDGGARRVLREAA
jgi:stearoyl-CoA desaturase (delta-9 desaturase)